MHRGRQVVGIIAACAALAVQTMPTELCLACEKPCCMTRDGGAAAGFPVAMPAADGCPLCAAHTDRNATDSEQQPCACQWEARHEQPLAPQRPVLEQNAKDVPLSGPAAVPPFDIESLGLSREYVATSLAIPIRPTRILLGVWRN